MLVSGVQRDDSTFMCLTEWSVSLAMICHRTQLQWRRWLCFHVVRYIRVTQFVMASLCFLIPLPFATSPLGQPSVWSPYLSLFLSCLFVHLFCFLDSTYKWDLMAFVFLSNLFHITQYSLGPSTLSRVARFRSFLCLSNIPSCICTTSLSICLLMDT